MRSKRFKKYIRFTIKMQHFFSINSVQIRSGYWILKRFAVRIKSIMSVVSFALAVVFIIRIKSKFNIIWYSPDPVQSKSSAHLCSAPVPKFWIRLRIRVRKFFKYENPTPVQTPATIIDPTEIYPCFTLRNDHTDSCYCRNRKLTPAPVFHNFLTPVPDPVSSEISDLCEISDLLLFFSYFASKNKEIRSGNYFFHACCVN